MLSINKTQLTKPNCFVLSINKTQLTKPNCFVLSINKTQLTKPNCFVLFLRTRGKSRLILRSQVFEILNVLDQKDLIGVFSSNLQFNFRARQVVNKETPPHWRLRLLSKGCWALLKLRNDVDLTTLKTVYYSLVYSYLQYCISSWGLASTSTLAPLRILHKRAIRITVFTKRQTYSSPLFYSLNILKIEDLFKFEIAKFVFKLKNIPDFNYTHNLKPINQIHKYIIRLSKNNYFFKEKN